MTMTSVKPHNKLGLGTLVNSFKRFYALNLFERVVFYIFLSHLFTKVLAELIQGMSMFYTPRYYQYIFFGLVALEYIINIRKIINIKFTLNYLSLFLFLLFFITLHGIFVGIISGNGLFDIFNDSVPLLVVILNALLMQSRSNNNPDIDIKRLLAVTGLFGFCICLIGIIAKSLGNPSTPSLGALPSSIYIALLFTVLFCHIKVSKLYYVNASLIILLSSSDFNRSILLFFLVCLCGLFLYHFRSQPFKSMLAIVLTAFLIAVFWLTISTESKLYQRIQNTGNIDFSASKGSIGERAEEFRIINQKLESNGLSNQWLGLGHGALYNVRFTHTYIRNYGHAHYSWALFKLRYGYVGYLYVLILALVLLYQIIRNWNIFSPQSVLISLFALQSFIYLFTYVTFIILSAGLTFYLVEKKSSYQNKSSL